MPNFKKTLFFVCIMMAICIEFSNGQWICADVNGGVANILKLSSHNGTIFAGDFNGLYSSTDSGNHWTFSASAPGYISSFAYVGTKTFAGINTGGVYRLLDNNTWSRAPSAGLTNFRITSLVGMGTLLFAGTVPCEGRNCDIIPGAVYVSADDGDNWTISGLSGQSVNDLLVADGIIYAATSTGIYRSIDNGATWDAMMNDRPVSRIAFSGSTFLAGYATNTYLSVTKGANWTTTGTLPSSTTITALTFDGTDMYAGSDSGVFISKNAGATWTACSYGLSNKVVTSLMMDNGQLFAGTRDRGIFRFNKYTGMWTLMGNGMTKIPHYVTAFTKIGGTLIAGSYGINDGIYLSTDAGKSWTYANQPFEYVTTLGVYDTHVFAGTMQGVYRSDDTCKNWVPLLTSGKYGYQFLDNANGVLYAFYKAGEMFKAKDGGFTWNSVGSFGYGDGVNTMTHIGRSVFIGMDKGAARSTDDGVTWTPIDNGILPADGLVVNDLTAIGGNLYRGGDFFGIYKSSDNGDSWKKVTADMPSHLGTPFVTDGGQNVFVGTFGMGIFHSSGDDGKWERVNPIPPGYVGTIFLSDKTLFVGTSAGIYYRPLSEITAVGIEQGKTPREYSLGQNYPNPFNPSTTIAFSLPSRSFVTLKIFDVVGREVASLVSEEMGAGNYSRQWNAGTMSSGIYFYRLQTGSFLETKRLVLLR